MLNLGLAEEQERDYFVPVGSEAANALLNIEQSVITFTRTIPLTGRDRNLKRGTSGSDN